jgi:hypothetical protein
MSYVNQAPASHIQNEVEMKAEDPTVAPKAELNVPHEDAEMEDLFGNDGDLEAKEDDPINRPG